MLCQAVNQTDRSATRSRSEKSETRKGHHGSPLQLVCLGCLALDPLGVEELGAGWTRTIRRSAIQLRRVGRCDQGSGVDSAVRGRATRVFQTRDKRSVASGTMCRSRSKSGTDSPNSVRTCSNKWFVVPPSGGLETRNIAKNRLKAELRTASRPIYA